MINALPVWGAEDRTTDWKTLYNAKIEEIKSEYETGIRNDLGFSAMSKNAIYFSVQDINFDGVPELYHALCQVFELDPSVYGNEELYYIKDGQLVQGNISEMASFSLLPMHAGRKADRGDVLADRWQFAMRNQSTGEVCFITNDSYSGFADYPERTYSKLLFDAKTGVLSTTILLQQAENSYTTPLYLQGYDYVGADGYNSYSENGWEIANWKPGYLAPRVVVNGEAVAFDAPPVIINGRTLVPIRRIADALGMQVTWDGTTRQVTMSKNHKRVTMTIGDTRYNLNGEEKTMDVCAQIMSDRTFVPARFVSEALGCSVDWDAETLTVKINEN